MGGLNTHIRHFRITNSWRGILRDKQPPDNSKRKAVSESEREQKFIPVSCVLLLYGSNTKAIGDGTQTDLNGADVGRTELSQDQKYERY
jgi:hypothetical protein